MKHGGDLTAARVRFGGTLSDWLDLSTGMNPHTYPCPENILLESLADLPSTQALDDLLNAVRKAYRVPDHLGICAAPGTQVLISLLPHVLDAIDYARILKPTYCSHEESWREAGINTKTASTLATNQLSNTATTLVNPNNPDGRAHKPADLLQFARKHAKGGNTLIIDEAYADIAPELSVLPHLKDEPVLVLRSFGKFFGMGGLRLGFLVGPKGLTAKIEARLGSWAISGPALAIGTQALNDQNWQHMMHAQLAYEASHLENILRSNQLEIIGGTNLFKLISHPEAEKLHDALASQRIWTRIFDYNPLWMRIGLPKDAEERDRLDNALKQALKVCTHA